MKSYLEENKQREKNLKIWSLKIPMNDSAVTTRLIHTQRPFDPTFVAQSTTAIFSMSKPSDESRNIVIVILML